MSPKIPDSLECEVNELRNRVNVLETAIETHGIELQTQQKQRPLAAAQDRALSPPIPSAQEVVQGVMASSSFSGFSNISEPSGERSLENQIGSQWFNRIGILAVLVGMALFLKLAIDNHWVGPLGPVLIGLFAGVGLLPGQSDSSVRATRPSPIHSRP